MKSKFRVNDIVGLSSNVNCGVIEKIEYSEVTNQFHYYLYPWSEGKKSATEDVVLPIKEWVNQKFSRSELEELKRLELINNNNSKNINATIIISKYRSLLSGRVSNVYAVVKDLKKNLELDL
jgi:hypothetical protein